MPTLFFVLCFCSALQAELKPQEPNILPSWNNSSSKQAIIDFVDAVTNESGPDFVPAAERIAVFDNDGTLWSEKPVYFQLFFALERAKALAPQHPEWKKNPLYKPIMAGDLKALSAGGHATLLKLMMLTHANTTVNEFNGIVKEWVKTAKHPETGKAYTDMVYQPMLEVLTYLRANGFKTYIVSGGGIEFMRPWTEQVYGIPPEQVIGSSLKTKFEIQDKKPVVFRLPEINVLNDKSAKPLSISQVIGRLPIMAFGNSDGDLEMLQWTTSGKGKRLGLIVHHTDDKREWAYDRESIVGKLDEAMDEAKQNGWVMIDMKSDWNKIYKTQE
mgnify:CR=1 FL=1